MAREAWVVTFIPPLALLGLGLALAWIIRGWRRLVRANQRFENVLVSDGKSLRSDGRDHRPGNWSQRTRRANHFDFSTSHHPSLRKSDQTSRVKNRIS
jgi:hypothetical protein